jgi:hypothetical protein
MSVRSSERGNRSLIEMSMIASWLSDQGRPASPESQRAWQHDPDKVITPIFPNYLFTGLSALGDRGERKATIFTQQQLADPHDEMSFRSP